MKRHSIFLAFLFFIVASLSAQEKSAFTLRDAVIGAYGEMKPTSLEAFAWLPSGARYSFVQGEKDASRLVIHDVESEYHHELTLSKLNAAFGRAGLEIQQAFPPVKWRTNVTFLLDIGHAIWQYDITSDSVSPVLKYNPGAANTEYNDPARAVAFTLGNNLSVQQSDGGERAVTNNENPAVVAGQAIHRYEFGIRKGIFWAPGGEQLAFYEKDDSNIPEFPIVNYRAEPAEVVGIRYPKAGKPSQLPKVGVFSLKTGQTIYLQTGTPKEFYLTNLTWSEDGRYIYLAEIDRDQRKMDLVRYNATTGERETVLFTETHEKYVEPEHGPIFIPGASGGFLWYSERDGFNHLYQYTSDGKLVRQLTKGEFDLDEVVGFSNDGRMLFVTAFRPALERNLFAINLRNGKMERITEEVGYHSAQLSGDRKYIMVKWSGPDVPTRNELYASSGKHLKTLHVSADPLGNKRIGSIELVTLSADDGTTLFGRLVKPSYFDANERYPVLVYVYGGPHVQLIDKSWLYGTDLWMLHLAEQGYLVFTLDNRGSAHRGLAFEQATFRQLGLVEIADQLRGVEYLKTLPYADTDRMAVYGWSFGGFMATSLMLRTPGIFKTAVAGGAVIDWRSYEVMYTERYMDTPEQNPVGYQRADLKNYVENLEGDLLMIHGTSDDVVILDHTMDFLNACIDKGVQVDYFNYPGYAHNVRGKDRLHLKRKIIDYVMEKVPSNDH